MTARPRSSDSQSFGFSCEFILRCDRYSSTTVSFITINRALSSSTNTFHHLTTMKTSMVLTGLAVLATSVIASVVPRDASTILTDIKTIKTQLQKVHDDVQAFPGGPSSAVQALQIKSDSDSLDKTLQQSAKDAAASSPLSDSDSATIATSVTGLQSQIYSTLDLLVSKEPGFRTAVFGSSADGIVRSTLVSLRTDTADFAGNVTSKLTPSLKRLAPLISSEIDFHYVRAIQAFSN